MHLLSMAFPNLEGPLFGLGQMVEEVVILPDYTVKELFGAIQKSLSEMESKSFETDAIKNCIFIDVRGTGGK